VKTTPFEAVLLKPLDRQADRDGNFIDPAGVNFDPETIYPIWRDFNYSVPDDMVGEGKVERASDGSLVVKGVLFLDDVNAAIRRDRFPYSLAIGVAYDKERNGTPHIPHSSLVSIGFTAQHVDLTQPPIKLKEGPVNLTRLGHYHTPSGEGERGSCRTALVTFHSLYDEPPPPEVEGAEKPDVFVNLHVFEHSGESADERQSVAVAPPNESYATFHLSGECPHAR